MNAGVLARSFRRQPVAQGLVLVGVLLAGCPRVFALDPALDVSQYVHTSWKIRDGFARGSIHAIAQTQDGYLWLGTDFGLLRFDGVRNVPWPRPDQPLPSNQITRLLVARDRTLWIGTRKGLVSWKDGRLTAYAELAGQFISALLEDRDGTVWSAAFGVPTGKLCAIQKGSLECEGDDGRLGRGVFDLYEDGRGNLWAGVYAGLWQWKPSPSRFYRFPAKATVNGLREDEDGALLVGGRGGGIRRFVDGKTEAFSPPGIGRDVNAQTMIRDRNGGLWIGTVTEGLVHVHAGRTDVFTQVDGLSGNDVSAFLEDREGNLWTATAEGLDRFRDPAVATFSVKQGVSSPAVVVSVLAVTDGSVWLGGEGGLNRWTGGRMTTPRTGSGPPDGKLDGQLPNSLFQDRHGRIWISTLRAVGSLENERFTILKDVPGGVVRSFAEDTAGNLWIVNQDRGLLGLAPDGEVQRVPWAMLGHEDFATALIADPRRGGLWVGFFRGDIAYVTDGHVRASYGAGDGLGDGYVASLRFDPDHTLWAATEGGLSRVKDGRVATLNTGNGLPCDEVHWSMEDDAHSLWLYTACALVHIARPELDAWVAAVDKDRAGKNKDTKPTIHATVFDASDGVISHPGAGGFGPLVARSPDGKLWFLPWHGVSVVDPRRLPFNKLPPPVNVEQVIADRKVYGASAGGAGGLHLPALIRDLEIDYTALSLVAPEKVRFRYKLEGRDRDWQDAGSRRQAFYSDLRPGPYRFRVIACNNSGVWNEAGTFLDFSVDPAYYQTAWFRLACVAAFLASLAALYRLRLQQVSRQVRVRTEARLEERERIARDLHDTLLQSVQGLILRFDAIGKKTSEEPTRQAIEETLDRADQVLAEARDRVRTLRGRAEAPIDLPAAFQRIAEEAGQESGPTFKTVVEGRVRELNPVVLEEAFSVGREALLNALAHSGGRHVEMEITYDPRQFRLRVRDDGRGIDPEILQGGRSDHWGVQGMRERAGKIGAQLELWSRSGAGTEVQLTIPAAAAYLDRGPGAKRQWFRRSAGLS